MQRAQVFEEFDMPKDGDEQKRIIKEAIEEWLEKKYAEFGKWSVRAIGAAAFGALLFWVLTSKGWTPPSH